MIPLPLLHDNPPPPPPSPLAGPPSPTRYACTPWHPLHPAWLSLDADLPHDHLARFVGDFVSGLDLAELHLSYSGRGSLPCPPDLLLRLVFFGYLRGRPSPQQWFQDSRESCPARWLLFALKPARSTLYSFRDRIAPFIDALNKQILESAFLAGHATGRRSALDGSCLRARASRHQLLTESGLRRRCQQLEEAVADDQVIGPARRPLGRLACWGVLVAVVVFTTPRLASAAASAEPVDAGDLLQALRPPRPRPPWMAGTPAGRREQLRGLRRAARRWRAKNQRQQAKAPCRRKHKRSKGDKKVLVCVSEPEAALGRDKLKVFRPLYNVQLLRDLDSELILAFGTFTATSDSGLLPVMLRRCQRLTGRMPAVVVADHNYATALDLAYCDQQGVTLYTPLLSREAKPGQPPKRYGKELFRYDSAQDEYVCPAGQRLRPTQPRREARVGGTVQTVQYQARRGECAGCAQRGSCTASKKGRIIVRSEHEELLEQSRQRLASAVGQRAYRLRKQTVELTVARLKRLLGGDEPLSSYGKRRARVQVGVAVLLLNALTLLRARQRAGRRPPSTTSSHGQP